jgi:PadR family transcriptional regulator AphA
MQDIQLTPTSYIVLGLLGQAGEATPYALKQMAERSVGHFWATPRSQLYAEPARLARAGYLTESQEPGGRRRKVYALTERGSDALRSWVAAPTHRLTTLRDLAFLKLYFGADPAVLADAQRAALTTLLTTFEAMRDASADAPRGARQTLDAGIDHVEASIRAWDRIAHEVTE